jgi:hypothetical protein
MTSSANSNCAFLRVSLSLRNTIRAIRARFAWSSKKGIAAASPLADPFASGLFFV